MLELQRLHDPNSEQKHEDSDVRHNLRQDQSVFVIHGLKRLFSLLNSLLSSLLSKNLTFSSTKNQQTKNAT